MTEPRMCIDGGDGVSKFSKMRKGGCVIDGAMIANNPW